MSERVSDAQRMKACMVIIDDASASKDDRQTAWDNLELLIESCVALESLELSTD